MLTGIEVDILEDGGLDQEDALLGELDIVVASAHSKLRMEPRPMTARLVAAVSNPRVSVLGHCHGPARAGRPRHASAVAVRGARRCSRPAPSTASRSRSTRVRSDRIRRTSCSRWHWRSGCLFSIDSDAHAPGQLSLLDHGAERAERAGVPAERIVTTWGLERLLRWAG